MFAEMGIRWSGHGGTRLFLPIMHATCNQQRTRGRSPSQPPALLRKVCRTEQSCAFTSGAFLEQGRIYVHSVVFGKDQQICVQ